ncbi:sugar dehydrogenase complex small subunit [Cupriavidus sp. UME77]|uniref:sugar dehydrogenase complex small subunit n=1 Tax=Cupriavidus sp. UME77 TaxID=1862321 RepID=UPI0016034656|nr:sugar dehydrogenase complex small subunit [Cupriavidus sp. UME77]MBB1635576.1 hypothetical protein [Cupriavidus sp. UME77]
MESREQISTKDAEPNCARRALLAGLLSTYTASLIPWALAQPVANGDQGAFLALSAIIAGRQTLDGALAKRLYQALTDDDAKFPAEARQLLALIDERKIDPLQLQQVLDSEQSPLATLPRKIATAWFMGMVGSGDNVRTIAYENALNAVIVSDVLKPPTYCYGVYGSWAAKPNAGAKNG